MRGGQGNGGLVAWVRNARAGRSLIVIAVAATVVLGSVSAAEAEWGPAVNLGSGGQPRLAISPSGAGALAFKGGDGAIYLLRRPVGGPFSAPQAVTPGGSPSVELEALALPDPAAVLLLGNDDGSINAAIQSSDGAPLSAAQQLVGPTEPDLSAGGASLLTTTRGDVLASTINDRGDAGAATLPFGGAQFGDSAQVTGFAQCGGGPYTAALATDDTGGAFAATGFGCSRISVFYRSAGGTFGTGHTVGVNPLNSFGLGAGGHGGAALAELSGAFRPGHVEIQVGHAGRFGRPHRLATTPFVVNTAILGPVVGRAGNVTVAWDACGSRQLGCSITAARGNVNGHFGPAHTLATTPRRSGVGVQAAVGPETVALQTCHSNGRRCAIGVVFAGRNYGFTRPRGLTRDGRIEQLASDRAGDEVIVWSAATGSLWAAERTAGRRRFGPAHRLAAPGTQSQNVSAVFGEGGEALIAWRSGTGEETAATYGIGTFAG